MKFAFVMLLAAVSAALGADATAGQAAFMKSCKVCHGPQGQGNPAVAKVLKATIPDLGSKEVQALSDADIRKIVTEGKNKMRPVKTIAAGDIGNVIAFVRTLKK